jgi:hypothetical protein
MTFKELKKDLDLYFAKGWSKQDFIWFCNDVDGRTRVGGPKGKGRLTARKALALLESR